MTDHGPVASSDIVFAADDLNGFVTMVLISAGLPANDASLMADSLVQADLWGHQSHGVLRLGWYLDRLRTGTMRASTNIEIVVDAGAVAVFDGHDGVGQVIAARAVEEAASRARSFAIGVVAVRNSNHFGTAAYFTRMAPPVGCIGILISNASPAMAPWGGLEKAVGNNPWSIAAPAGRHGVVVMDLSNTAVARGKIYLARQRGEEIPSGWAMDAAGMPTTDSDDAIAGLILPMAGHKGYAIAVMLDILAGVLTGSGFGTAVNGPYQADLPSNCGHLAIALNIDTFLPRNEFERRMEELIAELKSVTRVDGCDEILVPGEAEDRADRRQRVDGIALPARTADQLVQIAHEASIEPPPPKGLISR